MTVMTISAGHIHSGARVAHMPAVKDFRRSAAAPARICSRRRARSSLAIRPDAG
ncbi:Uncharacterised protein [Mycobacteroides abscessus subsp. abscessus]|nr:Uncharacterised protein [Mycobacteroides abscessus subsp. abscessus]